MANTLGSVVIQDLTYTQKYHGRDVSITYVSGGVAGSETVSVVDETIRVTIASGTSTATQVRAAVIANHAANDLVTVTISGTAGTAQVTCVNASLSGGRAVSSATLSVGSLLFTAATAGTAGNSVTVKFTAGATAGSEAVSVNTAAITIQIEDGVSTFDQIKTAYDAVGAATTLATVAGNGKSMDAVAYVASLASFVALSGGAAAAYSSVIVQDITYTSDVTGSTNNGRKITYTTGATAGAEVASGTTDISLQIENGVSTATQVKAALDAYASFQGSLATGSIVVTDYANLHLTAATDSITYGSPDTLEFAATQLTVTNYALLHKQKAFVAIQDLVYTAVNFGEAGESITVEYVGDLSGDQAVVEMTSATAILVHMDDTAVTGSSANTIKAAVNADPEASLLVLVSGASANVQAVQAPTNLADAQDAATVTVAGHVLTESTDWDAETSNDVTADNLAAAIDLLTEVTAANPAANVIDVLAATAGSAGNDITTVSSDETNLAWDAGTLAGGNDASTITVAGTTFTCVAAAPGAGEFSAIAELTTLITNLASVNATDNGSVIAVVAATAGTAGNSIAISHFGTGLVPTTPTLVGGIAASTVTVAGHALVESTNFNATVSNNQTATNIASAVNGLAEVNSVASTNSVNITAAATGPTGNYTLATSDAVRLLKSGSTMTGGLDGLLATISGTAGTAQKTVNGAVFASEALNSTNSFFINQATASLTGSYVTYNFGFHAQTIDIYNDETSGTEYITYSFDGANPAGTLLPTQSAHFDNVDGKICVISVLGDADFYRVNVTGV